MRPEELNRLNELKVKYDTVEVVRCKDCKYAHMTCDGMCKYCDMWEEEGRVYLNGDFYCAFGERKENETN